MQLSGGNEMGALIIALLACGAMITLVFAVPSIKIGRHYISAYWMAPLAGALLLILGGFVTPAQVWQGLTADSDVNPIKILLLFLSMTLISVFLDNTGFFGKLAMSALKRTGGSQYKLLLTLYALVSVLTVFTSNDIIVLTFTPFICYFAKNARIKALPYLISEFVAANTWSMALVIGNPTNIYLAGAAQIGFTEYIRVMLLPTVLGGMASLMVLLLIFRRQLGEKICPRECPEVRTDKPLMVMALVHLSLCIVMMTVSSYVDLPMWIIAVLFFLSLYLLALCYLLVNRRPITPVYQALKRAPFEIIPFILSMFVIVLALQQAGMTEKAAHLLQGGNAVWKYGISSFLTCNVVNNIPMSVLFAAIIEPLNGAVRTQALYAAVAGSNLGAFLTPIGALAGIMWMGLLKNHDVKLSFGKFVMYCAPVSAAALAATLWGLTLVL